MTLENDITQIRSMLEAFYNPEDAWGVALTKPSGKGVPTEMQVGPVNHEGWVQWKLLKPKITLNDLTKLEAQFDIKFPDYFAAFLLAACHLFDQVNSLKYDQLIFMPDVPSHEPLGPLQSILFNWQPLISASYIPFAEWGDGWGPMCFDTEHWNNRDCPIVWMEHEKLAPLDEAACRNRKIIDSFAQPLYQNTREFIQDVFQPL